MLKLIPLVIKFAPIIWAFIKEVVLKREDKRCLIRNKSQIFVTVLLLVYTLMLYVLHEGYNAHAKESLRKTKEIAELIEVVERKAKIIEQLKSAQCPDINAAILQDMLDAKTISIIELHNKTLVQK